MIFRGGEIMPIIATKQPEWYTGMKTVDPHLKNAYEALCKTFDEKYHKHLDEAFEKLTFTVEMLQEERSNDYHTENPLTFAEVPV